MFSTYRTLNKLSYNFHIIYNIQLHNFEIRVKQNEAFHKLIMTETKTVI